MNVARTANSVFLKTGIRLAAFTSLALLLNTLVAERSMAQELRENPFAGVNYSGQPQSRTRLDNPSVWQDHGVRLPQKVQYSGPHAPGSLVLDHKNQFLYFILPGGEAIEYVVAVGRTGSTITGRNHKVFRKVVNPEWYTRLATGGYAVTYGPASTLGPFALFLANENGVDEGFAIHGTNNPRLLAAPDGRRTFSRGCTRVHNRDIKDLFSRVLEGATVFIYYNNEVAPHIRRLAGRQSYLGSYIPTQDFS